MGACLSPFAVNALSVLEPLDLPVMTVVNDVGFGVIRLTFPQDMNQAIKPFIFDDDVLFDDSSVSVGVSDWTSARVYEIATISDYPSVDAWLRYAANEGIVFETTGSRVYDSFEVTWTA